MNNLSPKNYTLKQKVKSLALVILSSSLAAVIIHWFYVYWNLSTFEDKTTYAFILVPTLIVLYASSMYVLGFGLVKPRSTETDQ